MSKWGSIRISGPERIVRFKMGFIPLYLDGQKVRKILTIILNSPSSLIRAIKSDLISFFKSEAFKKIVEIGMLSFVIVCFLMYLCMVVMLIRSIIIAFIR